MIKKILATLVSVAFISSNAWSKEVTPEKWRALQNERESQVTLMAMIADLNLQLEKAKSAKSALRAGQTVVIIGSVGTFIMALKTTGGYRVFNLLMTAAGAWIVTDNQLKINVRVEEIESLQRHLQVLEEDLAEEVARNDAVLNSSLK
jgi:hypothetical protein